MAYINTPKGRFYFKQKTLYVGIKQINRVQAFENLKILDEVFVRKGVKYSPFFGTLLGIIRDNDFIEWDEDIDLCITKEYELKMLEALWDLKDVGFELVRYERRGLYSVMRKDEYIDFYILYKLSPTLRCSGGAEFVFDKYLQNTIQWDFKGIHLAVPKEWDECLTLSYGDWRTPVRYADFQMSPLKRFVEKSKYIIKRNLPNRLYYYLLHKYHKKSFARFKHKCEQKGIVLDCTF